MNTNESVSFGSGIGSSGSEVESAMFRPEVPAESGFRGRLDDLKSRSLSRVTEVRRVMQDRTSVVKANAQRSMTTTMAKVQSSMQANPAKWVGIAAGSGFAIGMLGRLMHWRNSHHRHTPQLVVIETSC